MFHEKKHEDEEILNEQNEVDFNSPEDLIELIQCKVTSRPQSPQQPPTSPHWKCLLIIMYTDSSRVHVLYSALFDLL